MNEMVLFHLRDVLQRLAIAALWRGNCGLLRRRRRAEPLAVRQPLAGGGRQLVQHGPARGVGGGRRQVLRQAQQQRRRQAAASGEPDTALSISSSDADIQLHKCGPLIPPRGVKVNPLLPLHPTRVHLGCQPAQPPGRCARRGDSSPPDGDDRRRVWVCPSWRQPEVQRQRLQLLCIGRRIAGKSAFVSSSALDCRALCTNPKFQADRRLGAAHSFISSISFCQQNQYV